MASIRDYITLIEKLNNSGSVGELEAALSLWVEGELTKATPEMMRLESIAKDYAFCSSKYIYRGFLLSGNFIAKQGLTVTTPPSKPYTSWSTSKREVHNFMYGFDRPWAMITKEAKDMKIYINLMEFDKEVKPFTEMSKQKEIIVKMPPTVHFEPKELQLIDWRNPKQNEDEDEDEDEDEGYF